MWTPDRFVGQSGESLVEKQRGALVGEYDDSIGEVALGLGIQILCYDIKEGEQISCVLFVVGVIGLR